MHFDLKYDLLISCQSNLHTQYRLRPPPPIYLALNEAVWCKAEYLIVMYCTFHSLNCIPELSIAREQPVEKRCSSSEVAYDEYRSLNGNLQRENQN